MDTQKIVHPHRSEIRSQVLEIVFLSLGYTGAICYLFLIIPLQSVQNSRFAQLPSGYMLPPN